MADNVVPFRRGTPDTPSQPEQTVATSQSDRLLIMLNATRERGMTWRDVSAVFETNHGSASGLLSRLHRAGQIIRLSEEREGSHVYVMPEWVLGRNTERSRRTTNNLLMDDMAAVLRTVPTRCKHEFWTNHCRSCEIRLVLSRYDSR